MSIAKPAMTLSTPTADEVSRGELGRLLREYNYSFVGEYPQTQPVWINARDDAGALTGGLRGFVFMDWFNVDVLFVGAAHRHNGLGSQILRHAESIAMQYGATQAKLETFEWQARAFYVKHGYEEFARIDNFKPGFYLAYMRKKLP